MSGPPPIPTARRKWLLWIAVTLGAVPIVVILAFCVFVYFYIESRISAMGSEASLASQKNVHVDPEELDEFYHANDNLDRLGDEYVKVFARYVTTYQKINDVYYSDRFADVGTKHSPEDLSAIRQHLDANAEYMSELRPLLNQNRDVRFPMSLWVGADVEFPHLSAVREAVRMLAAQSRIYAEAGNPSEVMECLRDSIYATDLLAHDPLLVPQLVRIATIGIVHDTVEYAANAVTLPDNAIGGLIDLATTRNPNGMIAFGLMGERCIAELPAETETQSANREMIEEILGRHGGRGRAREAMNANMFLTLSKLIRIGDLPPWERPPAAQQLQSRNGRFFGVLHLFDRETAGILGHAYQTESRAIANLDTMRVALAVLVFAHHSGRMPRTLVELVPQYLHEVPLDAFDGQPLRFKRTDKGFVVYSIGHDLDDDDGNPPPEGKKITKDGDVVFRVLDASPYLSGN